MEVVSPQISIIIPIYNAEKTLNRCLDSIKQQIFNDFEVLLIDDGSKDSSLTICKSYTSKDSRFKVFEKENGGASSARNIGLNNAKGEYIAFCDSDDYVEPEWLIQFINGMSHADIVISFFYKFKNEKKDTISYTYVCNDIAYGWASLEQLGQAGFLWNKCFRSKIIREHNIKFNENYVLDEDEEFVSHYLMYAKKLVWGNKPTYNYFEPNWNEKYNDEKVFNCLIDIFHNMKAFVPHEGLTVLGYTSVLNRLFSELGNMYHDWHFQKAKWRLAQIDKIILDTWGATPPLGLCKSTRFFVLGHKGITHLISIICSLLHII